MSKAFKLSSGSQRRPPDIRAGTGMNELRMPQCITNLALTLVGKMPEVAFITNYEALQCLLKKKVSWFFHFVFMIGVVYVV